MNNTAIIVPIYKETLDPLERLSLEHSCSILKKRKLYFIHPEDLNIEIYYKKQYPDAVFKGFDDKYFSDISGYNSLLLSEFFYDTFSEYKFVLILQPDAIVFFDDLEKWEASAYDYIGAPWADGHTPEIEIRLDNFKNNSSYKKINAKVGNGGLSLRNTRACISLLQEFPETLDYFLNSNINEDIFFACLGSVSKHFILPNEIIASMFALEGQPSYYYSINGGSLPMGSHGWWKTDYEFWSQFVSVIEPANARNACEFLALSRNKGWDIRNQARLNILHCSQSAVDLMKSTRFKEVEFTPTNNYRPTNPSITVRDDELWMIIRTLNYHYDIGDNFYYYLEGESDFRTINYLVRIDSDLSTISSEEILPPVDIPEPLYPACLGFEDSRLFYWKNEFWSISALRQLNSEGYYEQVLSKIVRKDDGLLHYDSWNVMHPTFCEQMHQKNWMPKISDEGLSFIYSNDPVRVTDAQGNLVMSTYPPIAADSFRGGTQLMEFHEGWLACIHETHMGGIHYKRYLHRFVVYDRIGRLTEYSEPFYFLSLGVEFAAGIARDPKTGDIHVSFGKDDSRSWIASFHPDEIKQILKPVINLADLIKNSEHSQWINSQTNRALRNQSGIDHALTLSSLVGIPNHQDSVKNWSNILAIFHTVRNTDLAQPILDVASTVHCSYLPGLSLYGYKDLVSINIDEPSPRTTNGIKFIKGDCVDTLFSDNFFGFVNCSSVLQFNVDINEFMVEASRILIPGGHLYVCVDYWEKPLDALGKEAFGCSIKIFTPQEIINIVDAAKANGLHLVGNLDLSCDEPVIKWMGLSYTFISLFFKKN